MVMSMFVMVLDLKVILRLLFRDWVVVWVVCILVWMDIFMLMKFVRFERMVLMVKLRVIWILSR